MLDDKDSYITEETFRKMYLPVLDKASECLKEKGYISEAIDFTNPTFQNTRYFDNLRLILEARIIKIYCMEVTKGTKFAKELNLSEVLDKIYDLVYNPELDCFINIKGECFAADLEEETLEPIPDYDQKIGTIKNGINPENATEKDFVCSDKSEFVVPSMNKKTTVPKKVAPPPVPQAKKRSDLLRLNV
jgi:hypothetical protein